MRKGQYIRLLLSTSANPTTVIGAAKNMQLHLSAQTEEDTTKDTTGDWLDYDVMSQGYDITGSALMLSDDDADIANAVKANDMLQFLSDTLLYWRICLMEGEKNRTVVAVIASGQCKLTQLQLQGQNAQKATYSYTLNGYGPITAPTVIKNFETAISHSDLLQVENPCIFVPVISDSVSDIISGLTIRYQNGDDKTAMTLVAGTGNTILCKISTDVMFTLTRDTVNLYKWNLTDIGSSGPNYDSFEWSEE